MDEISWSGNISYGAIDIVPLNFFMDLEWQTFLGGQLFKRRGIELDGG